MKLEQSYKFDVRDFESGKLIKALKEIKQRYGITEEENNGLENRKKVRHIQSEWVDDTTYVINVYVEKRNKWKENLKVRHQDLSRRDILQNRDMRRDVNRVIQENVYGEERIYGNWQNARRYQPDRRFNGWNR